MGRRRKAQSIFLFASDSSWATRGRCGGPTVRAGNRRPVNMPFEAVQPLDRDDRTLALYRFRTSKESQGPFHHPLLLIPLLVNSLES